MSFSAWNERAARLRGDLGKLKDGTVVVHFPGLGHSDSDRSATLYEDRRAPHGFRVSSFADDDLDALLNHALGLLGSAAPEPARKANGHAKPRRKVVAQYVYEDASGAPRLRKTRYEPKAFSASRPSPSGGWEPGGIADEDQLPFRLRRLLEAAPDEPVLVCEGEKSVIEAERHGLVATCASMGAGKWWASLNRYFAGKIVIITPDADEPGWKHALKVRANLVGVAASVKIVRLPDLGPGEDLFDYLTRGGNPQAIADMPDATPEPDAEPAPIRTPRRPRAPMPTEFTAAELEHMTFAPLAEVVPGVIAEGLTLFGGAPKRGKSWLALDCCAGVARGGFVLDRRCAQGDALYCALEDSPRRMQSRMRRVLGGLGDWSERLTLWRELERLDAGGEERLRGWIESRQDPRLIAIDTFNYIRPARGRDETPYEYDYRCALALKRIADDYPGLAIVPVHHTRKAEATDVLETLSGTNGLTGGCDAVMVLGPSNDGTVLKSRSRDLEDLELAVRFDGKTCRWSALGAPAEMRRSPERGEVLQALADASSPMTPAEIALKTRQKAENVRQLLRSMVSAGEVEPCGYARYRLPDEPDHSDHADHADA